MPTPTQPAPVTPPPEWIRQAAFDVADYCAEVPMDEWDNKDISDRIQKRAPPPAPACPTEQGELVERLLDLRSWLLNGGYNGWPNTVADAITTLSRQPAPSADASGQSGDGVPTSPVERKVFEKVLDASIAKDARIASLEAAAVASEENFQCLRRQLAKAYATSDDLRAQLRAAPSAVAQTEAGNDMTTRESKDSARLDWLAYNSEYIDFAKYDEDPEGLRAAIDAGGESDPVMSSPKSVSVPAVAGGGEDAAGFPEWSVDADEYDKLYRAARSLRSACKDRLPPGHYQKLDEECGEIDALLNPTRHSAAIAATKAKEGKL